MLTPQPNRLAVLLFGCLLCAGCTDVARLASDMELRQIQSCLFYSGSYGPFIGVHGVTATGGLTIEQCQTFR